MKPCTGCKHLFFRSDGQTFCDEHWLPQERIEDPYNPGGVRYERRSKYQQGFAFPMRVEAMRRLDGPCGPEGRLYEPRVSLLKRLVRRLGCGVKA